MFFNFGVNLMHFTFENCLCFIKQPFIHLYMRSTSFPIIGKLLIFGKTLKKHLSKFREMISGETDYENYAGTESSSGSCQRNSPAASSNPETGPEDTWVPDWLKHVCFLCYLQTVFLYSSVLKYRNSIPQDDKIQNQISRKLGQIQKNC